MWPVMRYSDTCSARRWLELWPPDADATHGAVQLGSSTQQGLPCRSLIALSMALGALDPGPPGKAESADAAGAHLVLRSVRFCLTMDAQAPGTGRTS